MIKLNGFISKAYIDRLFYPVFNRVAKITSSSGTLLPIVYYSNGYVYTTTPNNGDIIYIYMIANGGERIIDITWNTSNNRPIVDLYINGSLDSSSYDMYSSSSNIVFTSIMLSNPLNKGLNVLTFVVNGKSESSSGYSTGILGVYIR